MIVTTRATNDNKSFVTKYMFALTITFFGTRCGGLLSHSPNGISPDDHNCKSSTYEPAKHFDVEYMALKSSHSVCAQLRPSQLTTSCISKP